MNIYFNGDINERAAVGKGRGNDVKMKRQRHRVHGKALDNGRERGGRREPMEQRGTGLREDSS